MNGEKLAAQIKKVRPKYIKARVGPVDREYKAEQISSFYSKEYNTVFESHKIGKKQKSRLLGIYRDGDVIALCELKNMVTTVVQTNFTPGHIGPGGVFIPGSSSTSRQKENCPCRVTKFSAKAIARSSPGD